MNIFNIGDKVTWTDDNRLMLRRYGLGPFVVKSLTEVPYSQEDSMCKHCGCPLRTNGIFDSEDTLIEFMSAPSGCEHEEDCFSTYGGYNHTHWVNLERIDEKDARTCPDTIIGVHLRHWTDADQRQYDSLNTFPVHVTGIRRL